MSPGFKQSVQRAVSCAFQSTKRQRCVCDRTARRRSKRRPYIAPVLDCEDEDDADLVAACTASTHSKGTTPPTRRSSSTARSGLARNRCSAASAASGWNPNAVTCGQTHTVCVTRTVVTGVIRRQTFVCHQVFLSQTNLPFCVL